MKAMKRNRSHRANEQLIIWAWQGAEAVSTEKLCQQMAVLYKQWAYGGPIMGHWAGLQTKPVIWILSGLHLYNGIRLLFKKKIFPLLFIKPHGKNSITSTEESEFLGRKFIEQGSFQKSRLAVLILEIS